LSSFFFLYTKMSTIGVRYKRKTPKTIAEEDSLKRLQILRQKVREQNIKKGTNYHKEKLTTFYQLEHPLPYIPDGFYDKHKSSLKSTLVSHKPEWLGRIIMQRKGLMRESLRKHRPLKKSATIYDDYTGIVEACDSYFLTQTKRKEIKQDTKNHPRFPNNPLNENPAPNYYNVQDVTTSSPKYTFGAKEQGKVGGGQKAWASPYMRASTPFNYKTDYELKWPGPAQYFTKPTTSKTNLQKSYPKWSFGQKPKKDVWVRTREQTPDSSKYFPANNKGRKSPAYSFGVKRESFLRKSKNPPPDYYDVTVPRKHRSPAYDFNTREKRFLDSYHNKTPFSSV